MFAPDIERWLEGNSMPGYRQFLEESRAETADLLREAGVPRKCELADFYLRHGAATCCCWYGRNEPDQIADATRYVQEEWEAPEGSIALTNTEGKASCCTHPKRARSTTSSSAGWVTSWADRSSRSRAPSRVTCVGA